MALFTLVTRVSDGLPFMESTEALSQQLKEQAKSIAKRLEAGSPARLRVDCAGGQVVTYLMEEGLCFLVVTDASYPQRLTLSFLISLHREFTQYMRDQDGEGWRAQLDTCARAYAYQSFTSARLLQLRKDYADPSSSKAKRLAEELQDVHSIMRKNIQEVLQRGENLDHLSRVSSKLASDSKTFKWGAKKLNVMDAMRQWLPCLGVLGFVLFVFVWRYYFF